MQRLRDEPSASVAAEEFLCWLHREFYDALPERLRRVKGDGEESVWVEAGVLRDHNVQVGRHIAPVPEALESFLQRVV